MSRWKPGTSKVQFPLQAIGADGVPLKVRVPRSGLDSGDVVPLLLKSGHYVTPPMSGNAFSREALECVMPIATNWRFTGCGADSYLLHTVPFWGSVISVDRPLGMYRIHGRNLSMQVQELAGESIKRLQAYIATEIALRGLLEIHSKRVGKVVSPGAILENYSCLKARLALRRLGGRMPELPEESLFSLFVMLIRATWRSRSLNFSARCALTLWAFAVILSPDTFVKTVVSVGLTPSKRPEWLRSLILSLSLQKRRSGA
jgi:hypothetical protein